MSSPAPIRQRLLSALLFLAAIAMVLIFIALISNRMDEIRKAQIDEHQQAQKSAQEAQRLTLAMVHLLNGGELRIDDRMMHCKLIKPMQIVSAQ